jgi:hypothetical protein
MTRTDAELTTLYHSFFLIEYVKQLNDIKILRRMPTNKLKIDIIESGLKIFILETCTKSIDVEMGGNFVITTSDGSRYYAVFRSYDARIFVAVSTLPTMSFSKKLFELIGYEQHQNISLILLALCEIPIFPAAGLQYNFEFTVGNAALNFSAIEQIEDIDMDLIIVSIMSPIMLVKVWESIVLERKVLVISTTDSIITACCEYFRRMAIPLVMVNTFVPLLPIELIDVVDAPFPYLLGANTTILNESKVDLSSTVIVDLDTRTVIQPSNIDQNRYSCAPPHLIGKLLQEVNKIMLEPIGVWFNRPANSSFWTTNNNNNPFINPISPESIVSRATKVLEVFIKTNLSLISARYCSIRAFFRRLEYSTDDSYIDGEKGLTRKVYTTMGYSCNKGVYSGFMQLSRDRFDEDYKQHFIPCWVEMDECIFAAYEYADDLPLLYIPNSDIESISPSALEPEGHVFEIVLKDQTMYRFTATDTDARQQWIAKMEDLKKTLKMRFDLAHGNHTNISGDTNAMTPTVEIMSLIKPINVVNDHHHHHANNFRHQQQQQQQHGSPSHSYILGLPVNRDSVHLTTKAAEDEDSKLLNNVQKNDENECYFRYFFNKTQMMTSLHAQMDCLEFDKILKELNFTSKMLVSSCFESQMSKYLWTVGTIRGILDQIKKDFPAVDANIDTDNNNNKSNNSNKNNKSKSNCNTNGSNNDNMVLNFENNLKSSDDDKKIKNIKNIKNIDNEDISMQPTSTTKITTTITIATNNDSAATNVASTTTTIVASIVENNAVLANSKKMIFVFII